MKRSFINPKPSDYAGQLRIAGLSGLIGALILVFGLDNDGGFLSTIMVGAGVGLIIACGAITLTALRSKSRADRAAND